MTVSLQGLLLALVLWLGGGATAGVQEAPVERGSVRFVYDGDTILVQLATTTERVRYLGMDAPERDHDDLGASECFAEEAYEANRTLVLGEEVLLHRDKQERDSYGRLLRYVSRESAEGARRDIGEELVRGGYARARSVPPDTARATALAEAEVEARKEGVGLWGACE